MVEGTIIVRSFLFPRSSFLIHKHWQCKFTIRVMLLWLENAKCCQPNRGVTLLEDLWNVSPYMFWMFISETILDINQLKINWSSISTRAPCIQGTRVSLPLWGSGSQATSLQLEPWEVQSSVLPQSPNTMSSLLATLCTVQVPPSCTSLRHRLLPQGNKH